MSITLQNNFFLQLLKVKKPPLQLLLDLFLEYCLDCLYVIGLKSSSNILTALWSGPDYSHNIRGTIVFGETFLSKTNSFFIN